MTENSLKRQKSIFNRRLLGGQFLWNHQPDLGVFHMGKVKKGVPCSISGCTENAMRSLSKDSITKPLSETGLQVKGTGNRAYLCEKHYKALKKQLKKTRKQELMRLERPF